MITSCQYIYTQSADFGPISYYAIADDDFVTIQLSESALLFRVDKRIMLSRAQAQCR